MNKPRIIKSYEKLDEETLQHIKLRYPTGFAKHLIRFTDTNGKLNNGLPFETEDKYYLIRMSKSEALLIIDDDDDYDEDGNLLDEAREAYRDQLDDDEDDESILESADIDPAELEQEDAEQDED